MKKITTLIVTFVMLFTVCFSVAGCGGGHDHVFGGWKKDATTHWKECTVEGCTKTQDSGPHSYVNGVCVCGATDPNRALDLSSVTRIDCQSVPLTNIVNGTSDIAAVDKYIVDYYTHYRNLEGLSTIDLDGATSATEMFSFVTKKDSDFTKYFNAALYVLQNDGIDMAIRTNEVKHWTLDSIATMYNLNDLVLNIPEPEVDINEEPEQGSDYYNIKYTGDGNIKIAIAFPDAGTSWLEPLGWQTHAGIEGFMFYVAQAAGKILGLNVLSLMTPADKIDWNNLYKLNGDTYEYHVICGPLTADLACYDAENDEDSTLGQVFDVGVPYMKNYQVLVTKTSNLSQYPTLASLANARFVAETGSAAEAFVKGALEDAVFA